VPKSATFVPPRFPLLLCRWHQYGRSALQRAGKNFKTQELDLPIGAICWRYSPDSKKQSAVL
jgi:hypothetical protein